MNWGVPEKLVRKIGKICDGADVMAVYVALRDALERVLGQIPEPERRNSLTLQLIHSILLLPAFDLPENELHRDLSSIAAITDVERRHSEIRKHAVKTAG